MSPFVQRSIGIVGVITAYVNTMFWAYWGITENFHEGWYHVSLIDNIILMFVQYLSPFIISFIFLILAVSYPRIAAILSIGLGVGTVIYIENIWLALPFAVLGVTLLIGDTRLYKRVFFTLAILPILLIVILGGIFISRVSGRLYDGDFGERVVAGNMISLTWAPRGPGFPNSGVSWEEANRVCQFLSEDGETIMDTPQLIWRLPSAVEFVRSFQKSNENCGGVLDMKTMRPSYQLKPDTESPLWDRYSPIIYYWTSTEKDSLNAYIVSYDGGVFIRRKNRNPDYLGFRAVK